MAAHASLVMRLSIGSLMTFGMIKAYDSKHNNEAFADAAAPREKMLLRRSVGMLYRRKRTAAKSKPGRTIV